MKRSLSLLLLLALIAAERAVAQDPALVLHDVHIASPERGEALRHQTVTLHMGAIVDVSPAEDAGKRAAGAQHIEGEGRYLAPGFYEMHVHLPGVQSALPAEFLDGCLEMMLRSGVTTARVGRGSYGLLETKRAIAAGTLRGPRLFVPAPGLHRRRFPSLEAAADTYAVWRAQGFDAVKFLSAPEGVDYEGHVAAAHAAGMPWFGHAPGPRLADYVLPGHVSFEHAGAITKAAAAGPEVLKEGLLAMGKAGVFVCPDLDFYYVLSDRVTLDELKQRPGLDLVPESTVNEWVERRRLPDPRRKLNGDLLGTFSAAVPAIKDAGVKLLISGSDADFVLPGPSIATEASHLVKAGYSPTEVFRMATLHGAECLQEADVRGKVGVGYVADLVLLRANPFETEAALGQVDEVFQAGVIR